jgi:hypothetical protein
MEKRLRAMPTEAGPSQTSSPILVALSAARRCAELLETAAALATSSDADLEVMLVEDANLARLADLPVTREIDRVSGVTRELDSARVKRALEGEARRLRHALARICRTSSIRSTVRVVRGQILSEALAASQRVDVTFVHDAKRTLPGESGAGGLLQRENRLEPHARRRAYPRRKPVWTLYAGDSADMRALQIAARLAHLLACGLVVLIPHRTADEAETYEREVRSAVDNLDLRFVQVPENRSLLRERLLTPGASSLLVLAKHVAALEEDGMPSYLESSTVPLVLVA